MTQHTPGPWCVREGGTGIWADREYPRGSGVCLLVKPPYYDGEGFPLAEDVLEANARLIAKAPEQQAIITELLEALRTMLYHFQPTAEIGPDEIENAVAEANAAIAKAEGVLS